jgi:endonuclease I
VPLSFRLPPGWKRLAEIAGAVLLLHLFAAPVVASAPPGYYNRTFGLSGEMLQQVVHELIRDHTSQPYTQAFQFDAWDALQVLDRDPASPGNVLLIFSGASVPGSDTQGGSNPKITSESWEREHLWPRSYGLGNDGADFSDLFNLRPINQAVNQTRGNRIFDEPDLFHGFDPAAAPPGAPECLYDPLGGQGRLWAPRPAERGDIARAMFYMAVRYDGRDELTTPLRLSDDPDTLAGRFGRLSTLLRWHAEDPVDEEERRRNDLIFERFQGNRNPFVDDPGLAERVFGNTAPPRGLNLMLNRSVMALDDGPAAVTGVVTLSDPAPVDTEVTLTWGEGWEGVTAPATLTIQAGEKTAAFAVDAAAPAAPHFSEYRENWVWRAEAESYGTSEAALTVLGAGGRGWETFDRLLIYGNAYRAGEFTGQNGVRWFYRHATAEQDFPIDGRGILFRRSGDESALVSGPIQGGIESLAIDLRKGWTSTGLRQIEVLINGVSRGLSPGFGSGSGADATVITYLLEGLDVEGDFSLEIRHASGGTSNRHLVIDNIRWTGFPRGEGPGALVEVIPGTLVVPGNQAGAEIWFRLWATGLVEGENLLLTAPPGFELALAATEFATTLPLEVRPGGVVDCFAYLRLQPELGPGDFEGWLTVAGAGAAPQEVRISGTISEVAPVLRASGYRQEFGEFAQSGTLPPGWRVEADGSATNRYSVSLWGTTDTGIKYGPGHDPLLGYQHSASTGSVRLVAELENASAETIRALEISYTGRSARAAMERYPVFAVSLNGVPLTALAYSSEEADGQSRQIRIGGLAIPPGGRVELVWHSDRGEGSGASRQIGLAGVKIGLPAPPAVYLVGEADIVLPAGDGFIDPGAVAEDWVDGPLPVAVSGDVDALKPGIYTLNYQAMNSVGLTSSPVIRRVTVLHPLEYYLRVTHRLDEESAGYEAIPAGDALPNLLKYALGGNPTVPDPSILPALVILERGAPGLAFRAAFPLEWDALSGTLWGGGIHLGLEQSLDLVGWAPVPALAEISGSSTDPARTEAGEEVVLHLPDSHGAAGRLFLRLRVEVDEL